MQKKIIFLVAVVFVLSMLAEPLQAQTPGNVNNSAYTWAAWLTPDSYNAGEWTNHITNGIGNFADALAAPQKTNTGGFNFHPAVKFDKASVSAAPNQLYSKKAFSMTSSDNVTMFFVLQRATTDVWDCLFGFCNADFRNQMSWRSGGNDNLFSFWFGGAEADRKDLGAVKSGLFTVDNSNTNSSTGMYVYKNGTRSTAETSQWNGTAYRGNGKVALAGGRNDQGFYGYQGNIQEFILVKKSGNGHLADIDIQKIHSYLAIKYGLTLSVDYVASDGTTKVWNRTLNNGYNNHIFGIARDDAYGLYQKQSQSANVSSFTAFVGSNLANLNSNNNGQLNNGVYAMFGSNNGNLNNVVMLGNALPIPGSTATVNYRKSLVYKAQITGSATTKVKLKIADNLPLPEYVLVSTHPDFLPATTRVIPVAGNVVEGDVPDGSYIAFGGYLSGADKGPGGVTTGLKLWLRADETASLVTEPLITSNASGSKTRDYPDAPEGTAVAGVSEWKDLVRGQTYSYAAAGSVSEHLEPVYQQSNYMTNYHPAVRFWGTGSSRSTWLSNNSGVWATKYPTNHKHSAFFVVNNNFGVNRWFNILFFGSAQLGSYRGPGYAVDRMESGPYNGNVVGRFRTDWEAGNDNSSGTQHLFEAGSTSILGYHIAGQGTSSSSYINVIWRFNGKEDYKNNTIRNGNFGLNQESMIGPGYDDNRSLQGVVSEVIMYDGELHPDSLQAIESYLALKYGITLAPTNTSTKRFDYKFSDGTILWNGNVANGNKWATYYNRVAATIRDDDAALNNRHSHSTIVGSIVHMGVAGKKLGTRVEVGNFSHDKEAVAWGDDSGIGVVGVAVGDCGDFETIFKRKWLVHKMTENNRPVQMLVGAQDNTGNRLGDDPNTLGLYNLLKSGYDVSMIVADSPEKLTPGNALYGQFTAVVPMQFLDGEQQCSYTFTDSITYITFGCKPNRKGCVGEVQFDGIKTFNWSQWNRQNYGSNLSNLTRPAYNLGDDVQVSGTTIQYQGGVKASANYPSVTNSPVAGALYLQRREGAMDSKVTVTIHFNRPVRPEFSIYDLDGYWGRREKVLILGECASGGILPDLSYAGNAALSYYKIEGNSATVTKASNLEPSNKNGQLNVSFRGGVTKITIEYSITGATPTSILHNLIISPLKIRQQPLPPPVNEDGLSFTKDVKEREISTCESMEYSFYIENVNCNPKYVNFRDTLPNQLRWEAVIGIDSVNALHNPGIKFNDYEGKRILQIDSLLVPGDNTLLLTATAVLDENAVSVGDTKRFNNRAFIDYERIVNNIPTGLKLGSLDRETLEEPTWFDATWAGRMDTVLLNARLSSVKYSAGQTITVTLEVNNPNVNPVMDMYLNIGFDAGFQFNSAYGIQTTRTETGPLAMLTPDSASDPYRMVAANTSGTSGFVLPDGVTIFTFQLIAPAVNDLAPALDENGNPVGPNNIAPLIVQYEFLSGSSDSCISTSLSDMSGELRAPYYAGKSHILINQHITTKIIE